jgi:hypothetical protein
MNTSSLHQQQFLGKHVTKNTKTNKLTPPKQHAKETKQKGY